MPIASIGCGMELGIEGRAETALALLVDGGATGSV